MAIQFYVDRLSGHLTQAGKTASACLIWPAFVPLIAYPEACPHCYYTVHPAIVKYPEVIQLVSIMGVTHVVPKQIHSGDDVSSFFNGCGILGIAYR